MAFEAAHATHAAAQHALTDGCKALAALPSRPASGDRGDNASRFVVGSCRARRAAAHSGAHGGGGAAAETATGVHANELYLIHAPCEGEDGDGAVAARDGSRPHASGAAPTTQLSVSTFPFEHGGVDLLSASPLVTEGGASLVVTGTTTGTWQLFDANNLSAARFAAPGLLTEDPNLSNNRLTGCSWVRGGNRSFVLADCDTVALFDASRPDHGATSSFLGSKARALNGVAADPHSESEVCVLDGADLRFCDLREGGGGSAKGGTARHGAGARASDAQNAGGVFACLCGIHTHTGLYTIEYILYILWYSIVQYSSIVILLYTTEHVLNLYTIRYLYYTIVYSI